MLSNEERIETTKKTAFILILVLVASVVLGFGIKDRLSRQGGDGACIARLPRRKVHRSGTSSMMKSRMWETNRASLTRPASRILVRAGPCHQQNLNLSRLATVPSRLPSLRYSIAILYGSMIGTQAAMTVRPISGSSMGGSIGKDIFGDRTRVSLRCRRLARGIVCKQVT